MDVSDPEPIINVEATAYTAECPGCIGITKTGVDVKNTEHHEGKRVIAVDPAVIALGTEVEVTLASGSSFKATAEDIGSEINGHEIDILVPTLSKAQSFGRQEAEVRILN